MATAEEDYEVAYESWDVLREAVESKGGVLRVEMWELRDLEEAGRLGVHVRASISRRLSGLGLAHLPEELPAYQEEAVVLYKLGTPAAAVINAVRSGGTRDAENALRRLNTSRDSERLQAITEKFAELAELIEG